MAGKTPKIYTRTGDHGETGLIGGKRVSKAALRIEAYGTVDELNSFLGAAMAELATDPASSIISVLEPIQVGLFDIGSHLACPDTKNQSSLPAIKALQITAMEDAIDRMNEELPPLKNFILPRGTKSAGLLHISRTVCRRAERLTVRLAAEDTVAEVVIIYLNRLSDLLFVMARFANLKSKNPETVWEPL